MMPDQDPYGFFGVQEIGSLFLLCSDVERSLREALTAMGVEIADQPHGLTAKIERWDDLNRPISETRPDHARILDAYLVAVREAISVRNRIAHGLVGYSGRDDASGVEARLTTDLNGEVRYITATELDRIHRLLDRARNAIPMLTRAGGESPERAARTYLAIMTNFMPPARRDL